MKYVLAVLALGLFLPVMGADKAKEKSLPFDFKSLKALAEKGNAEAQFRLGAIYQDGQGVLEDDKEAVKWYRKAAAQGHAEAQVNLGNMYDNGEGVLMDDKEAMKWYRKSAEQGFAEAQILLGIRYFKGEGVLEDIVTAYAWFNIAAANREKNSQKAKDLIAKHMTAEDISKAQALSKEMVKKNPKLLK